MPEQTLIIVALPNGLSRDGTYAQLSLYIAPRLTGSESLLDFPDWLNWPNTLGAGSVAVRLKTNSGHTIDAQVDTSALQPQLWQGIFGLPDDTNATYVAPYEFDDYTNRLVISYPALEALAVIKAVYQTYGTSSPGEPPNSRALGQLAELLGFGDQQTDAKSDTDRTFQRLALWVEQRPQGDRAGNDALGGVLASLRQRLGEGMLTALLALDAKETALSTAGAAGDDGIPTRPAGMDANDVRALAGRFKLFHSMPPAPNRPPLPKTGEEFRKTLDFHKALAALTAYPTLMRALGLVLDVAIPLDQVPPSPSAPGQPSDGLRVEELRLGRPWAMRPSTGRPITRFVRQGAFTDATTGITIPPQFATAPRLYAETPELVPGDPILGYLPLWPGLFNLAQVDVDGALLKMLALASGYPAAIRSTAVGMPTLRTAGISLLATNRAGQLLRAFQQSKAFNDAVAHDANPSSLYALDVVRGYRLDVWDSHTGRWHSLHQRHARYLIEHVLPGDQLPPVDEEGFTQLAVIQPAPDPTRPADPPSGDPSLPASGTDLYLHERVARWGGWSLSAPRPGRALSERADPDAPVLDPDVATQANQDVTPFPMHTEFKAYQLPELRFGRRYRMRARAVDLAGNGLTADAPDIPPLNAPSTPQGFPYLRYEPVASPALMVRRVPDGPGETLEHLIIRTRNTDASLDTPATPDVDDRHIAPPRTSVRMAEWHGMLDDATGHLKGDAPTFQLISERDKGQLPVANLPASMRPPAPHRPHPGVPLPEPSTVREIDTIPCEPSAQLVLPYLPDPLARGAALRDLPGAADQTDGGVTGGNLVYAPVPGAEQRPGSVTHIPFDGAWPDRTPFRLHLCEGDEPPAWDAASRVLTVSLPKAGTAEVPLSCYLHADDLPLLGMWQWLREALLAQQAEGLQAYKLSADMAPRMETLATSLGDLVRLALEGGHWMLTPARTLKLIHAVQQPIGHPAFSYLPVTLPTDGGPHGLSSVPLYSPSELTPLTAWRGYGAQDAYLLGGLKVHGASTGKVDIEASWTEPKDNEQVHASAHVDQVPLHSTLDAVLYADGARAVGQYSGELDLIAFLNQSSDPAPVAPRHHFNDTRHRMVRYRAIATTRFRDEFPASEPDGTALTFTRASEEVVVDVPSTARPAAPQVVYVVPTFGWTRETTTNLQTSVRQGRGLRVYLERPWFSSGEDELLGVTLFNSAPSADPSGDAERERHKAYVTQWGMDPLWQTPALMARVPGTGNFPSAVVTAQGLTLEETQDLQVDVAAHAVQFDDADRQLWYSDIVFEEPNSYAPFVRLALARYQQHALPGVELSHVVLADFAQLTPDRAAALTSDPYAPRRLVLVVSGRAPEAPYRTTIVVTVQRRVAHHGSDLGWEDVSGGEATITPASGATSVPDTALWAGIITLAADPDEDEYRLIIREYESLRSDAGDTVPATSDYAAMRAGGSATAGASDAIHISQRLVYAEFFPIHAGRPA
jgi:hypothetical protein